MKSTCLTPCVSITSPRSQLAPSTGKVGPRSTPSEYSSGSLSRKPIGARPISRCSSRRFASTRPTVPAPTMSVGAGLAPDRREATMDEMIPARLAVRYTVEKSQSRTPWAETPGVFAPTRIGTAMVAIDAIAVAPAIVRRSSRSWSRRRVRYRPPAASSEIATAGKPTIHPSESESPPTPRPESRSAATASVRTTASTRSAIPTQLRPARGEAPARAAGATTGSGLSSEVGSRIDIVARQDRFRVSDPVRRRALLLRAARPSRSPADPSRR